MSDDPVPPVSSHPALPRILSLFDATMIVVGSIIGSGIFLKVGNVDSALKQFGFLPIIGVWIFVGVVTLCGSLALAELGAMYPHAGGPYLYLREAFGRLPAFLWGWTEFWVVRTGSVGALACATVIYFNELVLLTAGVPLAHWVQGVLAITIVIGLSGVNLVSTRWGASVQNVATVAKVGFLIALILLPFSLGQTKPSNLTPMWTVTWTPDLWRGLGVAMIAVFWPYDGWINLAPVAEEIRDPQRNVPRALAIGIGIVVLAYVGANLSYHLVLTMPELAASKTPAADVFRVLFGEVGVTIAAVGVMCSTFGATNSNMIAGPRIYFAVSRDGLIPQFIERVHPKFQTPANAILIQAVWTTLLMVVFYAISPSPGDVFDEITDVVIVAGLIFYSLTVGAVYVLRAKHPELARPYKTWGYPFTPALMIAAYFVAFVGKFIERWEQIAWVLGLIAAGIVYYQWASRTKRGSTGPG